MKKYLPILITAIVVGALCFYVGLQYSQSKAGATQGQGRNGQNGAQGRAGRAGGFGGGNATMGEIISADDKSVTVKQSNGSDKIIFFSGSTHIAKSVDAAPTDLVKGQTVMVNGTPNTDGSITAQNIQVRPPMPPSATPAPTPAATAPAASNSAPTTTQN